ncbi:hypothetical protein C8R47DRAFT_1065763 [Mycena vitilis]|nr:hypothetical protein C8R47DRAFT_1065763 [Mycena vitilis]
MARSTQVWQPEGLAQSNKAHKSDNQLEDSFTRTTAGGGNNGPIYIIQQTRGPPPASASFFPSTRNCASRLTAFQHSFNPVLLINLDRYSRIQGQNSIQMFFARFIVLFSALVLASIVDALPLKSRASALNVATCTDPATQLLGGGIAGAMLVFLIISPAHEFLRVNAASTSAVSGTCRVTATAVDGVKAPRLISAKAVLRDTVPPTVASITFSLPAVLLLDPWLLAEERTPPGTSRSRYRRLDWGTQRFCVLEPSSVLVPSKFEHMTAGALAEASFNWLVAPTWTETDWVLILPMHLDDDVAEVGLRQWFRNVPGWVRVISFSSDFSSSWLSCSCRRGHALYRLSVLANFREEARARRGIMGIKHPTVEHGGMHRMNVAGQAERPYMDVSERGYPMTTSNAEREIIEGIKKTLCYILDRRLFIEVVRVLYVLMGNFCRLGLRCHT